MASLSAQPVTIAGLQPSYAAASDTGDTAPVGARLFLHVVNGSAGEVTVTVTTPGAVGGLAISDAAQAVPAAGQVFIPLAAVYRNPSTGRAAVTYSAATDVDVAVLQLP